MAVFLVNLQTFVIIWGSFFVLLPRLNCEFTFKYEFQKLHSTFNHPVNRAAAVGPRRDAVVSDEGEILTEASEAGHPKVCTLAARRWRPANSAICPKTAWVLQNYFSQLVKSQTIQLAEFPFMYENVYQQKSSRL